MEHISVTEFLIFLLAAFAAGFILGTVFGLWKAVDKAYKEVLNKFLNWVVKRGFTRREALQFGEEIMNTKPLEKII